ncbi:kinase-like protein, partial [Acephala macrosclerotiorum]
TSQRISATSYKLFALLVRLRLGPYIRDFLAEGVDDSHLPFARSDRENKAEAARKFKLCSGKHPGRVVRCMIDLDDEDVERIFRAQWEVNAQVFEFSDDIEHYNLDPNSVLPWVEDHQHESSAMQGGFGSVWKVRIHPDHRIKGENGAEPFPRFIACKELHFKDEQTFQSEVNMLRAFKKSRHAHLVKLLATFHFDGKYYLLFPCAESNLRQYWHRNPRPDFTPRTVYWMLSQCKAVADALYVVHEYRSTRDALNSRSVRGTNQSDSAPFANIDNLRYGRHGDIKPENILWFFDEIAKDRHDQGRLVIADFGLTEFHSRASRSKVPAKNITGSATYEPPELLLDTTISRAYDIWSLGCVYLEFVTWLLCSPEAFSIFPQARLQTGEMEVDNFFTILKTDPPSTIVRKSVQDWIRDLHREPRCSNFIHEFLYLISDRMLVVNPKDRIVIGMLRRELQQMVNKAKTDLSYLTEST